MSKRDLTVWTEDYKEHNIVPDIGIYFPSRPMSASGPCILIGYSMCGKFTTADIADMLRLGAKHSKDPDVLSLFQELKTSPKTLDRTTYFYLTNYGFISIELYANENESRTLNSTIQGMIESVKIGEEDRYTGDESSGSIYTPDWKAMDDKSVGSHTLPSNDVVYHGYNNNEGTSTRSVFFLAKLVGQLLGASIAVYVLSFIVGFFHSNTLSRIDCLKTCVLIATLIAAGGSYFFGRGGILFAFCYIPAGLVVYWIRRYFDKVKIEEVAIDKKDDHSRSCRVCGSEVGENDSKCPKCYANMSETEETEEE